MQRQLAEKIAAQVVPICIPVNFKNVVIRNNHLWATLEDSNLVYVNLNENRLKEFNDRGEVSWFSVSPNGEYCYVIWGRHAHWIHVSDLKPNKATVFEDSQVVAISWLEDASSNTLYAFIALADRTTQTLGCYALSSTNKKTTLQLSVVLASKVFNIVDGKIVGLHTFKYTNGCIGLIVLLEESRGNDSHMIGMDTYLLNDAFLEVDDTSKRNIRYVPETPKWFSFDHNIMKFVADHSIFIIELHADQTDLSRSNMLKDQRFLKILPEFGILECMALGKNIFLTYGKQRLVFFIYPSENFLFKITVKHADMFVMDPNVGQLYACRGRTLMQLKFQSHYEVNGSTGIMYWLYERLLENQQMESIADVLSRIPIPLNDMITMARRHSAELEFHLFKKVLDHMKPTGYGKSDSYLQRQRIVIAHCTLDLYVRLESTKEDSNPVEFSKWVTPLIRGGLIPAETVRDTIRFYAWEKALTYLNDPVVVFDSLMENNMIDEALKALEKITNPDDFFDRCLRLYVSNPATIIKAVQDRQDTTQDPKMLFSEKVIPILASDEATPYVKEFYNKRRTIQSKWASDMFCLRVADLDSSSETVKDFLADKANSSHVVEFLCRTLASKKKYAELAEGLKRRGEYVRAAGVAARGDPNTAFDYLPGNDVDIKVRSRCASRILNSISRETAEEIAEERLLDSEYGIDIATLIEYLPDKTEVKQLSQTVACYNADQKGIRRAQEKMQSDALEGMRLIQKLSKDKVEDVVNVRPYQPCSICGKSLFTEQGIVYPCQHSVHDTCAYELTRGMAMSEESIAKSCPICSILSVRMIDEPFGDSGDDVDPWSVSKEDLEKLYL